MTMLVLVGCGRLGFDPAPRPAAVDCGDNPAGHCYALEVTLKTWDAARESCESMVPAAHLATIEDAAENLDAFAYARTVPFDPAETTNHRSIMWLGGNDFAVTTDWVWLTGEPMDYANWRAGEPSMEDEHCLIMLGAEGGLWDNRPCTEEFAYLCERDGATE